MKDINNFIQELEGFKSEMGRNDSNTNDHAKVFILERKQRELTKKREQIQEEIQNEIEDFFSYLNMKQASIEILSKIDAYAGEELKSIEKQLRAFVK